ncbi:MAG TPA: aldo/keto reductase [Candidatus Wunengus sp. YC65]|uniref:aldo/keto reductase n=1 Tax=Candidatus Wunengus sp. YC65 TaxID=3367701 RepID=UPI004026223F
MKIGLGTVQFGLDYGISNSEGVTPLEEVREVLTVATRNNIRVIDTAAMYGGSEEVLGKTLPNGNDFDIVTKTPRFDEVNTENKAEFLEQTFRRSLKKMNRTSVYGLLIHNADDLLGNTGNLIIGKMKELKEEGIVKKIGVSVYSSEQIDKILDRLDIDIVQLPINVLDQRLLMSGHLAKVKNDGIEIHARSAFLQGLLLMEPTALPSYFDFIKPHLKQYRDSLHQYRLTPLQAALSFVAGINEVDVVVCGVNNHLQLEELCGSLMSIDPAMFSNFAIYDEDILNPSKWKN